MGDVAGAVGSRVVGESGRVFYGCRSALRHMVGQRNGAIVSTASDAGLVGWPGQSAYCASKAGVVGLTQAVAMDAAPYEVRVNCVCPAFTDTPLVEPWVQAQPDPSAAREEVAAGQPVAAGGFTAGSTPSPNSPQRLTRRGGGGCSTTAASGGLSCLRSWRASMPTWCAGSARSTSDSRELTKPTASCGRSSQGTRACSRTGSGSPQPGCDQGDKSRMNREVHARRCDRWARILGLREVVTGIADPRASALRAGPRATVGDACLLGSGSRHRSGYLGGNCEFGTGAARLAVGALLVKPITAQLMSTPTEP